MFVSLTDLFPLVSPHRALKTYLNFMRSKRHVPLCHLKSSFLNSGFILIVEKVNTGKYIFKNTHNLTAQEQ